MMKPNPFTPKSGETPHIFLNRVEEINFFKERISEAKAGKFNHYIILGEWGIGKTVLLMYLKNIAQKEMSLCAYFSAQKFKDTVKPQELSLHLLQSIAQNLPFQFQKKSNFFKKIKGFGIQIVGTGFNLNFKTEPNSFIDPQILLTEGLLNLWEDIKKETSLITVLIDDVQNYENVSEIFITLKNVLSDEKILNKTKFLFVLSSAPEGWQQFLIKHHPIGRYFIPVRSLKPFSQEDTYKLILRTLEKTEVSFSTYVLNRIWEYTQGHLFEIHSLGKALYNVQTEGEVDKKQWELGYKEGLNYLGETVFENRLSEASEREKESLFLLSFFNDVIDLEKILKKAKELRLNIGNINDTLRRLVNKRLILNPKRGYYFIEDKSFRDYIKSKSI